MRSTDTVVDRNRTHRCATVKPRRKQCMHKRLHSSTPRFRRCWAMNMNAGPVHTKRWARQKGDRACAHTRPCLPRGKRSASCIHIGTVLHRRTKDIPRKLKWSVRNERPRRSSFLRRETREKACAQLFIRPHKMHLLRTFRCTLQSPSRL